jgi:hypothetical protein
MRRSSKTAQIAVAVVVLPWVVFQVYSRVDGARTTDQRIDDVVAAWEGTTDPRGPDPTGAQPLPDAMWRLNATWFGGYQLDGDDIVLAAEDGSCGGPRTWQATVRETDDLVVVLLRERESWVPDIPTFVSMVSNQSCAGVGFMTAARVRLDSPLGGRKLIDAISGARAGEMPADFRLLSPEERAGT